MQAFVYDKQAGPAKLSLQQVPKPALGAGEVLVKVHQISLNAADYRSLQLGIIPKSKILGSAIAGTVEAVGAGVKDFTIGDTVLGDLADSGFGGCAEYCLAPVSALTHKPAGLSFTAAAALPVAATTALQALRNVAPLQASQEVLLIGSSGGVGTYAIQLAKYFGAIVTGVCSTPKLAQTRTLGADYVIDYTQTDWITTAQRYDLILAINGNYPLTACKRLLKPQGTYVMVGGAFSQIFKALLFGRLLSFGSKKVRSLAAKARSEDLALVAQLTADGHLKPLIERHFPFEETPTAMQYLLQGHASGKIIIDVC